MAMVFISDKQYANIIEQTDKMPEQYIQELIRTAIENKQRKQK